MSVDHALTGASYPLRLGNRDLMFSPLNDVDISELDLWIQARYMRIARESLKQCSAAEREETLSIALRVSAGMSAFSGPGARMLTGIDGMTRLVWQCCRKQSPDLTELELRRILFDPTTRDVSPKLREQINEAFRAVNTRPAVAGTVKNSKPAARPMTTRRVGKKIQIPKRTIRKPGSIER
jgi:hypothetical protein